MHRQLANTASHNGFAEFMPRAAITRSGDLDALVSLEEIGTRLSCGRNQEIYIEGDATDDWYRVVSGTVRICKLLADGRRHIAEFCFSGDCFGLDSTPARVFSAEAVTDAIVLRLPRKTTEQLIEQTPAVARLLRKTMLRDLANAHSRMLLLGRMTASERVAAFLIELADRRDMPRKLNLAMSRNDIADYLGLTIETVCRVLSAFKRAGVIEIPDAHHIELRDRTSLEASANAE